MSRNYYEPPRAGLTDRAGRPTIVESMGRRLVVPSAALAALPMIVALEPYYFAWRAYLYLGHWPYYGHPDPKDLPEHINPSLNFPVVLIVIFLTLTSMITLVGFKVVRPRWRLGFAQATLLGCWLLAIALVKFDPFGVMEWIWD